MDHNHLVGQKLLLAFQGKEITPEMRTALEKFRPAGITLFRALNIDTPAQVKQLVAALQQQARNLEMPPLLIAADQEGGQLMAVGELTTPLPGNMALGATGSVELARRAGEVLGRELAAMGINIDYAPCCDVNVNPLNPVIGTRSFGEDPQQVAKMAAAMIEGIQSQGVAAVAKHFPGHGGTFVNSHYSIPKINYSLEEWDEKASKPFRKAIENKVDFVMMGHINYPNITDEISSSSPFWMNGILREKLGFTGIIVTDDIYMLSPNDSLDCSEEIAKSINNGADMTIFVDNPKCDLNEVYQYLTEFNLIDEDTIDERVENILKIKMQNLCTLKTDEPS